MSQPNCGMGHCPIGVTESYSSVCAGLRATQCGFSEHNDLSKSVCLCIKKKTSSQGIYVTQSNACDGCDSCCSCGLTY